MTIRPIPSHWLRLITDPLGIEATAREARLTRQVIEEDVQWTKDTSQRLRSLSAQIGEAVAQ